MSVMFPHYPSSPFQNVPSTPLPHVSRREIYGNISPSSISTLQYQTLYSSPIPTMNVYGSIPVHTPSLRSNPSQTFSQEESVASDTDIPLLTETAEPGSEIEQVVPASPYSTRQSEELLQDTHPLQIPFRTELLTSATPRENVESYLQESPEFRPDTLLSQDSDNTQLLERTPISSISRGLNVRQTPRRGIDNFRSNSNAHPVADELQTPRRQSLMLHRVHSPFVSINAVQLDFFNQDDIFA